MRASFIVNFAYCGIREHKIRKFRKCKQQRAKLNAIGRGEGTRTLMPEGGGF